MSAAPATPARATAASALTATTAILPVFLLGATAVSVRTDLGFSESALGVAVAAFWATMALGGVPGGRLVQRLGPTRSIRTGAVAATVALLGTSTARSFSQLVGWMLVGGLASGLANPATDLTIARSVPEGRRGLAFGVKQSAIPTATLLAGLAVPAFALTVGWRWAYLVAALLVVPVLLVMPRLPTGARDTPRSADAGDSSLRTVLLLAAAAGLAMAAMTAGAAFYVESAARAGVALDVAGTLLATGSLFGIAGRLGFAWGLAEARRPFLAVAALTGLGGIGSAVIGSGSTGVVLLLGTVLAFGAGWGWNGLFVHAVVRVNPSAPAAAMGVVVTGTAIGGVVGPLTFGLLVEHRGYGAAWVATCAGFAVAALLMLVAAPTSDAFAGTEAS